MLQLWDRNQEKQRPYIHTGCLLSAFSIWWQTGVTCILCPPIIHVESELRLQGLLQRNTRENPSASVYRANPYLILKLEAEMSVRWDAGMINITAGMWGPWSISHVWGSPCDALIDHRQWMKGFEKIFFVILLCIHWAAECRIKQCIVDSRCRITLWIYYLLRTWMFMVNSWSCDALIVLWMSGLYIDRPIVKNESFISPRHQWDQMEILDISQKKTQKSYKMS